MTIYAGGVVVSQLLEVPFFTGAFGIVIITGLYTVFGGDESGCLYSDIANNDINTRIYVTHLYRI